MSHFDYPGACDCHSHVIGPFANFPLSDARTFDPPESPLEALEGVWESLGFDRAVLIQASAYGDDNSAMLAAIARHPLHRRGVAILKSDVTDEVLSDLHQRGIRAVRFNWVHHLLGSDSGSVFERLNDAACLLRKIGPLGWHAEVHIDIDDLELIKGLESPNSMPIVIDHMARIDVAGPDFTKHLDRLLKVLESGRFWAKLSGADRLAAKSANPFGSVQVMRAVIAAAGGRCVWGLDWPHVNLSKKMTDLQLVETFMEAAGDDATLRRILVENAAELYGFSPYLAG